MADLGKLKWIITASTTQFNHAMDKAKTAVKSIGTGLIALTAVAAGVGAAMKKSFEKADNIYKTAHAIGITSKQLQALRDIMEFSGGTAAELDKALLTFQRRLGRLKDGHGAALGPLEKYDKELFKSLKASKDIFAAMTLVEKAVKGSATHQDALNIVGALFGDKVAPAMVTALKNNEKGIVAWMDELIKSKNYMSDDMTKGAGDTIDAIKNLTDGFADATDYFLVSFAPEIRNLADFFRETVPKAINYTIKAVALLRASLESIVGLFAFLFGNKELEANMRAGVESSMSRFRGETSDQGTTTKAQVETKEAVKEQTSLLGEKLDQIVIIQKEGNRIITNLQAVAG